MGKSGIMRACGRVMACAVLAVVSITCAAQEQDTVFKGKWKLVSAASYEQSIMTVDFGRGVKVRTKDCDGNSSDRVCPGLIFMDAPPGYVDEYDTVLTASVRGNVADITYSCSRDCATYSARLVLDPVSRKMTVGEVRMTDKVRYSTPQSVLRNGMEFVPLP